MPRKRAGRKGHEWRKNSIFQHSMSRKFRHTMQNLNFMEKELGPADRCLLYCHLSGPLIYPISHYFVDRSGQIFHNPDGPIIFEAELVGTDEIKFCRVCNLLFLGLFHYLLSY